MTEYGKAFLGDSSELMKETRKAKSFSPKTLLSGWLYQTARLTASNFLRSEIRRQHREQEAYMQSTLTGSDSASWEHIAPMLDEAMGRLGEADRNAIVLRFFENKTPQEVATALKMNEVAARKRVSRALEKLRKILTKRGIGIPVAVLTTAISANSVQAAPVGLAATISATAVKGAAVAATVSTLVNGTLKLMTYAKLKLALYIGTAIVVAGGATTVVLSSDGAGGNAAAGTLPAQDAGSLQQLVQANNRFAIDIFRKISPKATENVFLSPYSISSALAMTWAGARGETADQMAKALHLSELPAGEVTRYFTALNKALADAQSASGAQLSVANSLWPDQPGAPIFARIHNVR